MGIKDPGVRRCAMDAYLQQDELDKTRQGAEQDWAENWLVVGGWTLG